MKNLQGANQEEKRIFALKYLPSHLASNANEAQLQQLLTTFEFLQEKLTHLGAQALIEDYASLSNPDMRRLQGSLRLSTHVLDSDPSQLAGQLLGRLWSSDAPMIKKLKNQATSPKAFPWLCPFGQILSSPDVSLIKSLMAHNEGVGGVHHILFTRDGSRLVSAGHDIKVWQIESSQLLLTVRGHGQAINCIALTPDNERLMSASDDTTLKLWDLYSGREIMSFKGHRDPVSAVVLTPDGRYAISAACFFGDYEPHSNPLIVWCLESGRKVMLLHGHLHSVVAIAISSDGQRIVSAEGENIGEHSSARNYSVKIWDFNTGKELITIYDESIPVKTVKMTPDGRFIVAAIDSEAGVPAPIDGPRRPGVLKVWDMDGSEKMTLRSRDTRDLDPDAFRVGVHDFVFLSEGKRMVSVGAGHQIIVWDMENGVEVNSFFLDYDRHLRNIVLSPDERYLVISLSNGYIKIFDWSQLKDFRQKTSRENSRSGLSTFRAITRDWKKVISIEKRTLKVRDAENWQVICSFDGHNADIEMVEVMPDNRRVISVSDDQVVKIWDIENGNEILTLNVPPPLRYLPTFSGIPITPDGRYAITPVFLNEEEHSRLTSRLVVWNLTTGKEHATIPLELEFPIVNAIAVSPDGRCVIINAMSGKRIIEVDIGTGVANTIFMVGHSVDELSFTPDGSKLVTSSEGGLSVWDLESRAELMTLEECYPGMMKRRQFVIEPRGRYLFSIGSTAAELDENNAEVFDLNSGKIIAKFKADLPLNSVFAAQDGATIALGMAGQVHFLELKSVETQGQEGDEGSQ